MTSSLSLKSLYEDEKLSIAEIGQRIGKAYTPTRNLLLAAGVTLRSRPVGHMLARRRNLANPTRRRLLRDWTD